MSKFCRLVGNVVTDTASVESKDCKVACPEWVDCGCILEAGNWTNPQAELKRITAIKTEAGNIILARYPQWKQTNMIARSIELDRIKSERVLSVGEQAEYDSYEAAWDWVKRVRSESDRLEGIPGATEDDGDWPE